MAGNLKKLSAVIAIFLLTVSVFASAAMANSKESVIVQQYRKALELNPKDNDSRYKLAVALLREKVYDEALEQLLVIYKSTPNDVELNFYIGVAYAGTDELEKAVESYKKVRDLDPKLAKESYEIDKALYNIGIAYQRRDDMDAALEAYVDSIGVDPRQGLAYCRRGEVYFDKKDYVSALGDFKTCELRIPTDATVKRHIVSTRLALALGYMGEKKYSEALVELKMAVQTDPNNENAVYLKGYLYYLIADYKQAAAVLSALKSPESANIMNELPPLLQNIAVELQSRDEWTEAEPVLAQAIGLSKKEPDLHYLLAFNYIKSGKYPSAVQEAKEVLAIDSGHSRGSLLLAIATEKLVEQYLQKAESAKANGNYTEAIEVYNAVLNIDPRNFEGNKGRKEAEAGLDAYRNETSHERENEIKSKLAIANEYIGAEKYTEAMSVYRYILKIDVGNKAAAEGVAQAENFMKQKKDKVVTNADAFFRDGMYGLALREYKDALGYATGDERIKTKIDATAKKLAQKVKPLLEEAAVNEQKDNLRAALKLYSEVMGIDPENQTAISGRNRVSSAVDEHFKTYYERGIELLNGGDAADAMENLRVAEKLKPDDAALRQALARASEGAKKLIPQKLKAANRALKDGRNGDAAEIFAEVLAMDEKNQQAAEGLGAARRQTSDDADKRTSQAERALRQGKYLQAVQIATDALAADKDNKTAKGIRDEAKQKIAELVSTLLKKGAEEFDRGDAEGASADFKKALSYDPSNQTAKKYIAQMERPAQKRAGDREIEKLYLKGIELYTDGKYLDAIKAWEKVLDYNPKHEKALLNIEKAKRKLEGVMDVK